MDLWVRLGLVSCLFAFVLSANAPGFHFGSLLSDMICIRHRSRVFASADPSSECCRRARAAECLTNAWDMKIRCKVECGAPDCPDSQAGFNSAGCSVRVDRRCYRRPQRNPTPSRALAKTIAPPGFNPTSASTLANLLKNVPTTNSAATTAAKPSATSNAALAALLAAIQKAVAAKPATVATATAKPAPTAASTTSKPTATAASPAPAAAIPVQIVIMDSAASTPATTGTTQNSPATASATGTCADKDDKCAGWAKNGECKKNPY